MSPYTAIMRRSGNCLELAHTLVSWLAGAGYDCFVVHGFADRDTCLGIRYRLYCPCIPDDSPKIIEEPPPEEEPRYKLAPLPNFQSKFVLYMQERERQEKQKLQDAIDAEKQRKMAKLEELPPDPFEGWRTHVWVLVLPGRRDIAEPFFIEPSEGLHYPLSAPKYQKIHAIYNHENYYVNLQDCSRGLNNISYDLCNLRRWEHLLPGEPFSRRRITGVDYADRNSAVDTEKHLDMPVSWVEKLELTADEYEQRYPGCYKLVTYRKVTHEKFSPYLQLDGIVERIKTFTDYALTKPIMMYEWYMHRADKMEYVKTDYCNSHIIETYAIGRSDQFKKHVYDSTLSPHSIEGERAIDFYHLGRTDHLARVECTTLTFNEYFIGRDDKLESRLTVYLPGNKRELHCVTESYGRNPEIPMERDVYKRIFNITDNTIELLYHYDFNFVTNDTRLYKKPNLAETAGHILFDPSKVSGYIANPIGKEPRRLEMYLTLCEHLEWENVTRKAIRDRETDISEYLKKRCVELQKPAMEVALFDTERNEEAKRGWKEQETLKAEVEERATEAEIDPLAPYLARLFGSGHGDGTPLSYKDACLVREQCICDFRAQQQARQQLVQARYDKLNEEYKEKRLWYLANQYILTPKKEAEYFETSAELAFQVHTLEVRLTRHRDLTGPRFRALLDLLNKHPLLKEYHRGK